MRWLALLLLMTAPSFAETLTTSNVVPNMSEFTTSGSTTSENTQGCSSGEFCTGNASNGGGTYTSTFDVPLTEQEIQSGFTVNSSVKVDSHISNESLSPCSSITQSVDCQDIFKLTVSLWENELVVEKFEHQVELDFGGLRDFTFSDNVGLNDYAVLTGSLELFGIDAGFHSGFFGPKFSDPSVTFTHDSVLEQQIIDSIASQEFNIAVQAPPPVMEIVSAPAPAPAPLTVASAPVEPTAPPPPPTIEVIVVAAPPAEQQQEEAQAEAAIEAEIEAQPAPEEIEPQQAEVQETTPEREQETPAPAQTRQQKLKVAAQRVVKKIAPSQRYSAVNQTTTLIVMNMIAGKVDNGASVQDVQGFFPAITLQDSRSIVSPLTDYTLFGTSNGRHDAFIELQWK